MRKSTKNKLSYQQRPKPLRLTKYKEQTSFHEEGKLTLFKESPINKFRRLTKGRFQ